MAENEIITSIGYETDQSSVASAKKAAQDIGKSIQGLEDQLKDSAKETAGLEKELQSLARAKHLDSLARSYGVLAREMGDAEKAQKKLTEAAEKFGATEDEIKSIARAFNDAANAAKDVPNVPGGTTGSGLGAAKFRGLASNFGGGETLGAIDDIQDAIEGVSELGNMATSTLIPALAGSTAGMAGLVAVALPIAVVLGAAALAVKAYTDEAQRQADEINAIIDARRSIADAITGGMTTEDAKKQIAELDERKQLEEEILADSTAAYEAFINGIREQFGFLAPIFEGVFKIFDTREEALATQIGESNKLIGESTATREAYNAAIEEGKFEENDAAAAAIASAEAQKKAADETARAAEKSAREQEQAAKEAQRAAEQAAKEVASAYKAINDSTRKYGENVKKINQDAANAVKDINTKAADSAKAERIKFSNDIAALTTKAHQAEYDADVQAYRDEAGALKDYQANVKKLTQAADDAKLNAQENRNFLEFAQSQKERQAELNAQGETAVAAKDAREQARRDEETDRATALDRARQERRQAQREQQAAAKVDTENSLRDAKIAKSRQLQSAREAYNSEQQQLRAHLQGLGGLRSQFYQSELQMAQQALSNLQGGSSRQPGSLGRGGNIAPGNIVSSSSVSSADNRTINTTINGNDTAQLYRFLQTVGYAR